MVKIEIIIDDDRELVENGEVKMLYLAEIMRDVKSDMECGFTNRELTDINRNICGKWLMTVNNI